jgi:hypothetical protein
MFDWENDVFLSTWDKKYVTTNLRPGSKDFDAESFKELQKEIDDSGNVTGVSYCILVWYPTLLNFRQTLALMRALRLPCSVPWTVQM